MEALLARRVIPMDFSDAGVAPQNEGPGRKDVG
jgi:hypothetical protein